MGLNKGFKVERTAHPRAGNKEACTTDTQKYTRNTQNENNVIMRGDCKLATTVTYSTAIDAAVLSMILLGEVTTPHVLEVRDN